MKPGSYRLTHCPEIGAQAVIACDLHHRAPLRGRRHSERISRPLHDERWDCHRIEFGETALRRRGTRPAWRLQRKRKAEHSDGAHGPRSPTRDTRTGGPTTDEERQTAQLARKQMVDHRRPRCIELTHGCRCTPTGDPIGLLDERNAHPLRMCDVRHCN